MYTIVLKLFFVRFSFIFLILGIFFLLFSAPSSPVQTRRLLSARNARMSSVEMPDENEKSVSSASTSPCHSPVSFIKLKFGSGQIRVIPKKVRSFPHTNLFFLFRNPIVTPTKIYLLSCLISYPDIQMSWN